MAIFNFIGFAPTAFVPVPTNGNMFQLDPNWDAGDDGYDFEIDDNDGSFNGDASANDEIGMDSTQDAVVRDAGGNIVGSGRTYIEAGYVFTDEFGGTVTLFRVEISGDLVGYIADGPIQPGNVYAIAAVTNPDAVDYTSLHSQTYNDFGQNAIQGTANGDTLSSDSGSDTIYGGAGNDFISSGNDGDTVFGGAGNDTIDSRQQSGSNSNVADYVDGGTGADLIFGSGGADTILGGDGNDTVNGNTGNDSIDGGAGNDDLNGDQGDDTVLGGGGNDSLFGGDGNDSLSGGDGRDLINGQFGDDVIAGGAEFDNLYGNAGADTIFGDSGADYIFGGLGADSLFGGDDADTFFIENSFGSDTIVGGEGGIDDDTIDLRPTSGAVTVSFLGDEAGLFTNGTDTASFAQIEAFTLTSGDDVVDGTASGSVGQLGMQIDGAAGDDVLIGGSGDDTLEGGIGSDTLATYIGDDVLDGGDDADTFIVNEHFAGDTIIGGTGDDIVTFSTLTTGIDVTFTDTAQGSFTDGSDTGAFTQIEALYLTGLDDNVDGTADTVGIEVYGGAGGDTIAGGSGDDYIDGGDGDDSLTTGLGRDTLIGGAGNDTLRNSAGDDSLVGGAGDDSIIATQGNDTLEGGDGDDTLDGGADNDSLEGGAGDDRLEGGTGDDYIDGGDGADTIILEDGFGNDTIFGGEGGTDSDLIDMSGLSGPVTVTYTGDEDGTITDGVSTITFAGIERLILTDSNDSVDATQTHDGVIGDTPGVDIDARGGDDTVLGGRGGDTIEGGAGNDQIDGDYGDDILAGGEGDDTLVGSTGNDTLLGGGGADSLDGGVEADTLDGGEGDDTLDGGDGDDSLIGGDGNDSIVGGYQDDTIEGGDGDDTLDGGDHDDVIFGGAGNDRIEAGEERTQGNDDYIDGGEGGDTITSAETDTQSNDTILGGVGNDSIVVTGGDENVLDGGADDDTITSGTGNDTLRGGTGDDVLTGGAGNDTFVYTPGDGADTITDFNSGNSGALGDGDASNNDFIDLSGYYDSLSELYADQADDGVLNQSNSVDEKGRSTDYSDNDQFGGGSLRMQGASADNSSFTADNTGVVCFTAGTAILTPRGNVRIDDLAVGDLVTTADNGPQAIRWIGTRVLDHTTLMTLPNLRPVLIKADALGNARPLLVSPQHCMLVGRDTLVRAKHLAEKMAGVRVAHGKRSVCYIHLMFDAHQIIFAENAPSESFYPGPVSLGTMRAQARTELLSLFPQLRPARINRAMTVRQYGDTARPVARRDGWERAWQQRPCTGLRVAG